MSNLPSAAAPAPPSVFSDVPLRSLPNPDDDTAPLPGVVDNGNPNSLFRATSLFQVPSTRGPLLPLSNIGSGDIRSGRHSFHSTAGGGLHPQRSLSSAPVFVVADPKAQLSPVDVRVIRGEAPLGSFERMEVNAGTIDGVRNATDDTQDTGSCKETGVSCVQRIGHVVFSIRALASLLCALFIIATAASLLVTTFTFSMDAALDIAEQYAVSISDKAKGTVEQMLMKSMSSLASWQYRYKGVGHMLPSDNNNPPALASVMIPDDLSTQWANPHWENFISATKDVNWMFRYSLIGFADGAYATCIPYGTNLFYCAAMDHKMPIPIANTTPQAYRTSYGYFEFDYLRDTNSRTSYDRYNMNYDPRTTDWYKNAPKTPNSQQWCDPMMSSGMLVMCAAAPLHNGSGTLLGVATFATELNDISSFIQNLPSTTPNTVAVLLDNTDLLLGTSLKNFPFLRTISVPTNVSAANLTKNCFRTKSSGTEVICRTSTSNYEYAPLRTLNAEAPHFIQNGTDGAKRMSLNGEDYFVIVVRIVTAGAANMNWRFVLFVPQSDITGGIYEGRNISIYIAIGIVSGAVLCCFVLLTLLLNPLKAVTERMYRLATLQSEDPAGAATNKPSRLSEISTIQVAFNLMATELDKVKSYLPQSVLAQLYGSITECDDDEGDMLSVMPPKSVDTAALQRRNSGRSNASSMIKLRSAADVGSRLASDKISTVTNSTRAKYLVAKAPALNTKASVSARKISVLAVNVVGYHSMVMGKEAATVMRLGADLVSIVSKAVNGHKGVVDSFQGDKFMVSFNAVTTVGSHAVAAVEAAHAVNFSMQEYSNATSRTPLRMTSGIATGPAMVGNMGTYGMMRFTVLGPLVTTASLLERLCKHYEECSVMAGGLALSEIENQFETMTMDIVRLPATNRPASATRIASVRSRAVNADDEWMYQLEANTRDSKFSSVNAAFLCIAKGNMVEEARQHLADATAKLVGAPTNSTSAVPTIDLMASKGSHSGTLPSAAPASDSVLITSMVTFLTNLLNFRIEAGLADTPYVADLGAFFDECVLPTIVVQ